jgi:hypothetical protein
MKYLRYFEERKINHKPDPIIVIVDSYLETAIWSNNDVQGFEGLTIYNFSDKARKQAEIEVRWFLDNAGDVFGEVADTTIGHDLWLSRNGHGSGFFDRDGYDEDTADFLMDLSRILGEIYLSLKSKKIYFEFSNTDRYKNFDLEQYFKDRELKKAEKKYNL